MLAQIIRFSLRNAVLVVVAATAVCAMAVVGMRQLPVDVFPELNAPTVTVMTEAGGLGAEEVEQYISFPIESAVSGLPGLRRVRSASALGLSIVWVEFDWGSDIYRARQMVGERLDSVSAELPPEAHSAMAPIGSVTAEAMLISLRSTDPAVDPLALRALAEFDLRSRLLTIPGVAQVVAIGGALPEYQVAVRHEALQLYDLTGADVSAALSRAHNRNSAGFLADVGGRELPLRQSGRVRSVADIKSTVVALRDGAPVTVADVADVRLGGAPRRGAASDDGEAAVVLSIQKAPGTNTLTLTSAVDDLLDQIEPSLPPGYLLNRDVFRQSHFITRSITTLGSVLIEAALIVTVILALFLLNLRTTLITLSAVPVSLAVTMLVMAASGMTINVMTLGGLAVAIGILVDDAIIDVENVHRRLGQDHRGRSRLRVIAAACNEIRPSVVFATIIICLAFVPLLFLNGLEGRFFRPLALTYIVSVMTSLLVALTLTPALCYLLLPSRLLGANTHADAPLVRILKRGYRPLLAWCLRARAWTLTTAAAACLASLALAATFGTSFLPNFNEGTYTVFVMMPPGTSLVESERVAQTVSRSLLQVDGVEHVVSRSGRAERDEHAEPPSSSELEVRIDPNADPAAVLRGIDAVTAGLPGITTMVGQPISHRLSHVLSGTQAAIAIDIYGDDLNVLRRLASEVSTAVAELPSTRDVAANREVLIDTLAIDFRNADLARYGLSAEGAGEQVQRALYGDRAAVIEEGNRRYDLVLRLADDQRDDLDDIAKVVLVGEDGALVRLHEVADIGPERASNLISRQNGQRKAVVAANISAGHNLGDTIAAVRATVDP
ncbi:MAG: efflux RND transporter permease subunit, partial [Planctomycetota bacterium]